MTGRMALDLFCGMGGASLGLDWAGFEVFGLELDSDAIALHQGGWVDQANITLEDPADHGDVDLLWASPPCQPFSHAGLKAGLADPRGKLVYEPLRWVYNLEPRWVVLEQVRAALPFWEESAEQLQDWGYRTWTGLLHAEQYGVPQTRTRAFLLACGDGSSPTPPPATHRRYWKNRAAYGWVSLDDAHLPCWRPMADVIAEPGEDVTTGCDWKTERADAQVRHTHQPAPTITSKTGTQWQIGESKRHLTVPEVLGLQTFPMNCLDDIQATRTATFQAIGNAVPPLLAQRIVEHLTKEAT